jgi:hypothetical protein
MIRLEITKYSLQEVTSTQYVGEPLNYKDLNPTQSTEFSVQIPTMKTRIVNSQNKTTDNQIFKPPACLHSTINYGMRDRLIENPAIRVILPVFGSTYGRGRSISS